MKKIFLTIIFFLFLQVLNAQDMVLIFDTNLSDGTTVTLPLYGTVDVTVDWGDGNSDSYTTTGDKDHTYSTDGIYTVSISGSLSQFGNGAWGYTNADKLTEVTSFGTIGITSLYGAFYNATNLTNVPSNLPSTVTSLNLCFAGATSFNVNINTWDVSSVTDMMYIFYNASNFNGELNDWNVSNVIYMRGMFYAAKKFNKELDNWDVSKVTDMWSMFRETIFNYNLNNWNVGSVTNMGYMFCEASNFNGDISSWDVSSVTNMSYMFNSASNFNGDLSSWNVSSVTDMSFMFCGDLGSYSIFNGNLSNWNVSSVTNMAGMFWRSLFNGDISNWNVSSVTDMSFMFRNAGLFNGDLSSWNVSSVISMSDMFNGVKLSTDNYSALLEGWAQLTLQNGVTFDGGNSQYYVGVAAAARQSIIDTYGWTITDGGGLFNTNAQYETEPNDSASLANAVALGDTILANISDAYGDVDYFKLSVTQGDTVEVYAEDRNDSYLQGRMQIIDQNGNYIGDNSYYTDSYNSRYVFVANYTGDYFIRFVYSNNWNGSFPNGVENNNDPKQIDKIISNNKNFNSPEQEIERFERNNIKSVNGSLSSIPQNYLNSKKDKITNTINTTEGEKNSTGDYLITFNHFQKQAPEFYYISLFDINYDNFSRVYTGLYPNGLETDIYLEYGENESTENSLYLGSTNGLNVSSIGSSSPINFYSASGNIYYKLRVENALGESESYIYTQPYPSQSEIWTNLDIDYGVNGDFYVYGSDFIDANNGFICGEFYDSNNYYNLAKTTNRGESWEFILSGNNIHNSVKYITSNKIIAVGYYGYSITEDGGDTWNYYNIEDYYTYLFDVEFYDENNGLIVGYDENTGEGIWRTTDGGANWTKSVSGLNNINEIYGVKYLTKDKIYVSGYSRVAYSTDGGLTWNEPILNGYGFWGVDFLDENIGFTFDYDGNGTTDPFLWKTTDGGNTWNPITIDHSRYYNLWRGDIKCLDKNKIILVGDKGLILRSDDKGETWFFEESSTRNNLYNITFINSKNGFIVGELGTILRTGDGTFNDWEVSLIVSDAGSRSSENLIMGVSSGATNGLDSDLGEIELPPLPPVGNFDSRFIFPDNVISSLKDFRKSEQDSILWQIKFQPGQSGGPITLKWNPNNLPTVGSFILRDGLGGIIHKVNMRQNTILVVNSSLSDIYIEYKNEVCGDIKLSSNWNLSSTPVKVENQNLGELFPNHTGEIFEYSNGYNAVTSMTPGKGYWIKNDLDEIINICGTLSRDTISLNSGWNMVGVYESDANLTEVETIPNGIIQSNFFGFDFSYNIAQILESGKGYWVKSSQDGKMIISTSTNANKVVAQTEIPEEWTRIILTDSDNKVKTFYIGKEIETELYSLPPIPPQGIYDVRFSNDKYVKEIGDISTTLNIENGKYPIRIKVEGSDVRIGELEGERKLIRNGGEYILTGSGSKKLKIESVEIPLSFELMQNYPNPFNPTTVIKYSIPAVIASDGGAKQSIEVTLKVYDILGSEVATLVNEQQEAGYHEVKFDAKHLTSGIYVYRITADKFSDVKKMLLIK